MQTFLRAADVAVLPYRQALNSGALMLALAFGLPAIVPAGSGLAEVVDDRFGRTFYPAGPTALADALLAAPGLVSDTARAAATATAAEVSPNIVPHRFALGLREQLNPAASPTALGSGQR